MGGTHNGSHFFLIRIKVTVGMEWLLPGLRMTLSLKYLVCLTMYMLGSRLKINVFVLLSSRMTFCSDVRQLALNSLVYAVIVRQLYSSLLESYLCYCYLAQNVSVCIRISFFKCNVFLYRVGNFSKMS